MKKSKNKPFLVIATDKGVYGDINDKGRPFIVRNEGDIFMIASTVDFSEKWMERYNGELPDKVEVDNTEDSLTTLSEMALKPQVVNR